MKVKRILILALLQLTFLVTKAQCPQVFDGNMNPSSHPYWISCSGGPYTLNFQAPTSWGTYTISWGDASPDFTSVFYSANSVVSHVYSSTIDTFVVTLNVPSLSCTMTGVVVMELPVNASLAIPVGGTNSACAPASLSFSNVSTNLSQTCHFKYTFGDNTPSVIYTYTNANTSTSHMYLPNTVTCQTNVTLEAWNYCTFTNSSVYVLTPINIYWKDAPAITTSASAICWPSNAFTFSNTSTPNCVPQGNNYQRKQMWRLGNVWAYNSFQDSIIPWSNTPPYTPVTVAFPFMGGFTVMLKDSNICGVDSVTTTVNIFNPPVANLVAPAGPFCQNSPITFTNNSTVGVLYKWDFGTGPGFFTLPAGPQTFSYPTAGTYTVRLVAYLPFSNSCSDTDQVVITIQPGPTPGFTMSPTTSCGILSNVSFTDTSVGATSWSWDFANTNTSILQVPPNQTYTNVGIHTISLTVTAANSCTSMVQHTVEVYGLPIAGFTVNSACMNSAVQFTDQSVSALPVTSYTWNFGDGSPLVFVQNPSHTYTSSAVFTVSLTVSNGQCTSSTYTSSIFVVGSPTASFVHTPTVGCSALTVSFTNNSLGTTVFDWNFGDGTPLTSALGNTTHTYINPLTTNQTITVTLIATNMSGCVDSVRKTILLYGKPFSNYLLNPKAGCYPLSLTFTNTSTPFASCLWDFGNGQTSTQTNPVQTFTNAPGSSTTLFPVKLVITNSSGCKDSLTQLVILYPRPMAKFDADTPACSPKRISFTNQSTGSLSYTWNFGGVGSSNLVNPSYVFTNTTAVTQSSVTQLVAINSDGCTDTANVSFFIYPKPNISLTVLPDTGCAPLKVTFPTVPGMSTYSWTLGDGATASTASVTHTYLNNGLFTKTITAQLIASDAFGCKDTAKQVIKVYPSPVALFDATPLSSYMPNTSVLISNLSTGASTYDWSFGDGTTSTDAIPTHSYSSPGSYQIVLVTKTTHACVDTFKLGSKITVLGETEFNIPNAFTPNTAGSPGNTFGPTDLSNDIFYPKMKGVVEYKFTIYSRWGEILFDTSDPTQGWDGYYKGTLCKQDVYVWKVYAKFYDDKVVNKTGDVTLLR